MVDNRGQVALNKTLPIADNSDYEDITNKVVNHIPKSLYYKPLSTKKTKTKKNLYQGLKILEPKNLVNIKIKK